MPHLNLGAVQLGEGRCRFRVWAPFRQTVALHLVAPQERRLSLTPTAGGYHEAVVEDIAEGAEYFFRLDDGVEWPDPASRFQPRGVHQPSAVFDPAFGWENRDWKGIRLSDCILYELHVGTFTPEGTFDAIIPRLAELRDLGVTAIELMPVAQFPGERNWGYDGVHPFAAQNSYGGPRGLQRLVNACHRAGLGVVLDVVYNHLGPEGNYLAEFGPYFTDGYKTPWGTAVNFDGPHSDEVRRFFIASALSWQTEFHVDALRIDAVHAIKDFSAQTFLQELAAAVHERSDELNRRCLVIAESDLNNANVIRPPSLGGYGLDAQWCDDFHHALHAVFTGEHTGYYEDFGRIEHLAQAFRGPFVYQGQHSPHRKRRHGSSPHGTTADQFVVYAQNHDQIGNRMLGERLSQLVGFEELKLAAGAVLLSPYVPLLFMGEEYGESAPFQYFISHADPALVEAVRKGRREEYAAFQRQGEVPDPHSEATFQRCKLNHASRAEGNHRVLQAFYKELIAARKRAAVDAVAFEREQVLLVRSEQRILLFNFGPAPATLTLPVGIGPWQKRLDSADRRWNGPGSVTPARLSSPASLSPRAFSLFERG